LGYESVVVGAVVHGVVAFLDGAIGGSDNTAFAIAVGTQNGYNQEIKGTFLFNEELGWFVWKYEKDGKTGKLQLNIFTKNGKQTITN